MDKYTFDLKEALGGPPVILEYNPEEQLVAVIDHTRNVVRKMIPPISFGDDLTFQLWANGFADGMKWTWPEGFSREEKLSTSLSSFSRSKESEVTKNTVKFSSGIYSYDFIVSGNLNNEDIVFNSSKVEGIPALVKLRGHGDKFVCELINCIEVWGDSEDQDVGDDYILPLWCQGYGHFNLYTSDYPGVYLQEGSFLYRSRGGDFIDLVYEVEQVHYKYNGEIDFIKVKNIPVRASLGSVVSMA